MPLSSFGDETDGQDSAKPASGFFRTPVLSLIHYYQQHISPNSIQRCPFEISCSHFAEEAVQRYGVTGGLIRTIDRYYYRENRQAFAIYERVDGGEGRLLLDDAAYLLDPDPSAQRFVADELRSDPAAELSDAQMMSWADQLYHQQEYADARMLYDRLVLFSEDQQLVRQCKVMKIRCYIGEKRYQNAVIQASELLGDTLLTAAEQAEVETLVGYTYMQQRIFPLAETHFRKALDGDTTGVPQVGLGLVALQSGNWRKSDSLRLELLSVGESQPDIMAEWGRGIEKGRDLKLRSPLLAASFSAVIPGSGQFYCQHQFDGVQAFTFVAGFAWATYMAYRYESSFHKPRIGTVIGGSLTLAFYTANIWGAKQTAIYRNMRMRDDLCRPMRERFEELME